MIKFNKINFGLLILLFLCRFESILGTSDKNIEERLKEKYKIVDEKGTILKNGKGEDFSFIVTCEYDGDYYKWFEGIESFIKNPENKKNENKKLEKIYRKDIVKTKDGKVLVVKDSEKENKVRLIYGICDKNSKTANICLDTNYKLQTSGPWDIIEENNIVVAIKHYSDCGGELVDKTNNVYKFQIVCCKLEDVKPDVILKELVDPFKKSIEQKDDFVKDSGCCDRLCDWCKNLCP